MVRIRLQRMGRIHKPFYRITAVDSRVKRDGAYIEALGFYDPASRDETMQVRINEERVKHWLKVGAQPSETVADLLSKRGLVSAEERRKKLEARIEAKKKRAAAAPAEPAKKEG